MTDIKMDMTSKTEPLYPPCECEYGRLNGCSRMRFEKRRADGQDDWEIAALEPWPERMCFARELIAGADPKYLRMGDGIVTMFTTDGPMSYGIVGENLMLNTLCGVRSPMLARDKNY